MKPQPTKSPMLDKAMESMKRDHLLPQPKEQSHSALPLRFVPSNSPAEPAEIENAEGLPIAHVYGCEPRSDSSGRLSAADLECVARARLIVEAVNNHARLLAQNEMLREALEEMLHYDSVGCVCPTEEIRSRNPCTTCKARAALEQTEKV